MVKLPFAHNTIVLNDNLGFTGVEDICITDDGDLFIEFELKRCHFKIPITDYSLESYNDRAIWNVDCDKKWESRVRIFI